MNFQAKKLDLIHWLSSLSDETIISRLYSIKQSASTDWYDELSLSQKHAIEKGLEDLDNNKMLSHEEVMDAVKSKIKELTSR